MITPLSAVATVSRNIYRSDREGPLTKHAARLERATVRLQFRGTTVRLIFCLAFSFIALGMHSAMLHASGNTFKVQDLDLSGMIQDFGRPIINKSASGGTLTIAGQKFAEGIGSHANATVMFDLSGNGSRFKAYVGADEGAAWWPSSLVFKVLGDGRLLWESGLMKKDAKAKRIDIDIRNVRFLELAVFDNDDGIDGDHANWCEPVIEMIQGSPKRYIRPVEADYILTPPEPPFPQLNLVGRYGARPGNEFRYRIPCTGTRPMTFELFGLPSGLRFDTASQTIVGRVLQKQSTTVRVEATNAFGKDVQSFQIVIGDTTALTPFLGWSTWYPITLGVYEDYVLRQAQILIDSGLADYGYDHVLIDDGWQDTMRGPDQAMRPNGKFNSMPELIAKIHGLGLKAGLYTSPGPTSCPGGYLGSYQHEARDAEMFCSWGVDYLKSDLCSYNEILADLYKKGVDPTKATRDIYRKMGEELAKCDRDIHYLVCTYGTYTPWKWGREALAHSWRSGGDIDEGWSGIGENGFSQSRLGVYSGPGGWNDLDHIRMGTEGIKNQERPINLTPNERYTKFSLWTLLKAPIILGFHLTDADEYTLSMVRNREVGQITRDALGKQAKLIQRTARQEVWAMPMADSSWAVGLFNRDDATDMVVNLPFELLGIQRGAPCRVRDLWRQRDVGTFRDTYAKLIPTHGVQLLRIWPNQVSSVSPGHELAEARLTAFPNPGNGEATLVFTPVLTGTYDFVITSAAGERVSRFSLFGNSGERVEYRLSLPDAGVYLVSSTDPLRPLRTKIVSTSGAFR